MSLVFLGQMVQAKQPPFVCYWASFAQPLAEQSFSAWITPINCQLFSSALVLLWKRQFFIHISQEKITFMPLLLPLVCAQAAQAIGVLKKCLKLLNWVRRQNRLFAIILWV